MCVCVCLELKCEGLLLKQWAGEKATPQAEQPRPLAVDLHDFFVVGFEVI